MGWRSGFRVTAAIVFGTALLTGTCFGCKDFGSIYGLGNTAFMAGPSKLYPVPISASACSWLHAPSVKCHELTIEEIQRLIAETERSAKLCAEAGADAFEMHAYGGYLNDQFLTAAWNTRTDKYGGDVKGRATFLLEQIDAVRRSPERTYPSLSSSAPITACNIRVSASCPRASSSPNTSRKRAWTPCMWTPAAMRSGSCPCPPYFIRRRSCSSKAPRPCARPFLSPC